MWGPFTLRKILLISFVVGLPLRFFGLSDLEWGYDEKYVVDSAQSPLNCVAFPGVGMASGVSLRNPGFSIWPFTIFSKLLGLHRPEAFSAMVAFLYGLSVFLLWRWVSREVKPEQQNAWLAAVALILVNPLLLLYSRKIWAQCLLFLPCVIFWFAWWRRERRVAALVWGFMGALLGQIHMSGFFFVPAVLIATGLMERLRPAKTRWAAWLIGSFAGSLLLIPWVLYLKAALPSGQGQHTFSLSQINEWLNFRFLVKGIPFLAGASLQENIGSHFENFLRWPLVGNFPTFLVAVLHGIAVVGILILLASGWRHRDSRGSVFRSLGLVLFLFGVLLTVSGFRIHRHYLIIAFPIAWVWLCSALNGQSFWARRGFALLWISNAALSILILLFLHRNHGAEGADYGITYEQQKARGIEIPLDVSSCEALTRPR